MKYGEAVNKAQAMLKNINCDDRLQDTFTLLKYVFEISRTDYLLCREEEADEEKLNDFFSLIEKHNDGMPVQYITGVQNFYGVDFFVNENVLIPRFDTEVLVEWVLSNEKDKDLSVLDMCTGSGCIILTLLKMGGYKTGIGVDISKEALDVARLNKDRNDINAAFYCGDLFEAVSGRVAVNSLDVVVSNPPYIVSSEIEKLDKLVSMHEPGLALDGGDDGLVFYRRIAKDALKYLKNNGRIYLEIGCEQAASVREILEQHGYRDIQIKKDYAGLDRCVMAKACIDIY